MIFKAMAARPTDIEDATALMLMLMHKDIDVDRVRRHLADLAVLADEPGLTSGLEAVIKLASAGRPSTATIKPSARSPRTLKAKRPSIKATAKAKSKDASKP